MTLLTEDEAHKKGCPFTFPNGEILFEPPSMRQVGGLKMCMASKCIAWRWQAVVERLSSTSVKQRRDLGYCGAFGKPQLYPYESDPSVKE